jgi:hypothetical protein
LQPLLLLLLLLPLSKSCRVRTRQHPFLPRQIVLLLLVIATIHQHRLALSDP